MTDDRSAPERTAEIYGYVDGRWRLLDAIRGGPREGVLRRAREVQADGRVRAVRVVMEKPGEDGGTRSYVAWRSQKAEDIPEMELSSAATRRPTPTPAPKREAPRPAEAVEPIPPPPIPPPLLPPDRPARRWRPDRRTIRLAVLGTVAAGALLTLFLRARPAMEGNGDVVLGTGAGLALMASGLWIARDLLRVDVPPVRDKPAARLAERRQAPEARPSPPAAAIPSPPVPPPVATAPDPLPPGPDKAALLPVLRLTATALRRLEEEGASLPAGPATRLALRLYVAGACEERALLLGDARPGLVADGLELLGESAGEAAAFAAALDDALLAPGHQILYRAGRLDLAGFAQGGGRPVTSLHRLLPGWIAWCAGRAGNPAPPARRAVLAVAPLAPESVPAVEAVVGAYGGEAFSRDGTALVATFAESSAAFAVAEAVRDAASGGRPPPGCGLVLADLPDPGLMPSGRPAAEALELARLSPGAVSTGQGLRASGTTAA